MEVITSDRHNCWSRVVDYPRYGSGLGGWRDQQRPERAACSVVVLLLGGGLHARVLRFDLVMAAGAPALHAIHEWSEMWLTSVQRGHCHSRVSMAAECVPWECARGRCSSSSPQSPPSAAASYTGANSSPTISIRTTPSVSEPLSEG